MKVSLLGTIQANAQSSKHLALQRSGSSDHVDRLGIRQVRDDSVAGDGRQVVQQGLEAVYRPIRRRAFASGLGVCRRRDPGRGNRYFEPWGNGWDPDRLGFGGGYPGLRDNPALSGQVLIGG